MWSVQEKDTASDTAEDIERGSVLRQATLIGLGCLGIISLMRRSRKRLRINGVLGLLVILFLLLAACSIAVSDNPFLTVKRVGVLAMLSLGALAVAERLTLHDVVLFAFWVGIISVGAGFACAVAVGTFKPLVPEYRFGAVMDKNHMAVYCGVLLISAVILAHRGRRTRISSFYLATAFVALVFLILTKSRGGIAGTGLGLAAYGCLVMSKWPRSSYLLTAAIFTTASFVCVLWLLTANQLAPNLVELTAMGRDLTDTAANVKTLTGRVPFWEEEIFPRIRERPLLGYGYDSFWSPKRLLALAHSPLRQTHNGYLDLALSLGVTGSMIYILIRIFGIMVYLRLWWRSGNIDYACATALLISFSFAIMLLNIQLETHLVTFVDMTLLAWAAFVSSAGWRGHFTLSYHKEVSPRK